MNLTDLGEVLRSRADVPGSSHDARMAGVRARVVASRRRRAVAGVACLVLALVGLVFVVLPRAEAPEPAVPPRSLPEYQSGTRLSAQAWGDLPATGLTLRFVPRSLDFQLITHCDTAPDGLRITVTVNGHVYTEDNGCGGMGKVADWGAFDVVAGRPSVVEMTVRTVAEGTRGSFAVGIGDPVPVSEYPFPPRPATLQTFPLNLPEASIFLRPDAGTPNGEKRFTLEWPGESLLRAQLNTPGRIRVLVDGVGLVDFSHWSYTASSSSMFLSDWKKHYGLDVVEGQRVEVTVITERITGDWQVSFAPR
ncbi:hypothetical protein [Lentzea sp. NPDC003310]|uniref:hypothetical protein n=1 Tax=Lentzea sp. NPDC003310 TaxID=3154447 RepID=UPI00339E300D